MIDRNGVPVPDPACGPAIGVIVPTFNRADILVRCLQHLESQTLKDFEVVVVDDGSTDDTSKVLEAYSSRTPLDFRYVRQTNKGAAAARNHAVSLLQAPICVLIGDDILVAPDFLERHVGLHTRVPARDAVALGLTRWSETGQKVTPFMRWLDADGVQFAYRELQAGSQPTWKHFYTSNLSLKTEHLRRHRFEEGFGSCGMEDIELGYRMARGNELSMHFLPEALGDHVHPTDVTRSCRRLIGVGAAAHDFDRMWPEQATPLDSSRWKHTLRTLLTQQTVVLPVLRAAAGLLTRVWCPNPLLTRVMMLHYRLGYQRAATRHSAAGL